MKHWRAFFCPTHGAQSLLITQREPTCCHRFEVRCKACDNKFIGWANPSQANDILAFDLNIETKDYVPGITEFEKRFGRKP
jgi:hypothetical protein